MLEYPDSLIDPSDYKEVIQHCHEKQIFAVYHQKASGVLDQGWNQDGFGYCWAYGLTMATMDARALEGQSPVRLAPFSLGWLVGWKNQGYYCDRAIAGAKDKGIASAEFVPEYNTNYNQFKSGWQQDALNYRPTEWWDMGGSGNTAKIQQCLTILATGRALYVAYNWWGHALEVCGMRWDESEQNNVVWILRNSHNENDVIELTGSKGVPDEAYGVRSTSLPAA
jgi:hypothetical protein